MTINSTTHGYTPSKTCRTTKTASEPSSKDPLNIIEPPTSLWGLALEDQRNQVELNYAAELFVSDDPEEKALGEELANQFLIATEQSGEQLSIRADEILEFCDKLDYVAKYQKARAEELKFLADRTATKRDKIKKYVMDTLHKRRPDQKTIYLPTHEMRSKLNTSCEITDESLIPSAFMTTPRPKIPAPHPNKDLIKKFIQAGQEVAGAVVNEYRTWTSHKPKPKSKPQPRLKQQEPPQLAPVDTQPAEDDEGW